MRQPVKFQWRGIHHLYLGLWFIAFGLFFLYMNWGNQTDWANCIYAIFIISGLYCVIDDIYEHTVDKSPLRRLWEWMIRKKEWW